LADAKMTELVKAAEKKGIDLLREEDKGEFDQEKYPGYRWTYRVQSIPTPDFAALISAAAPEDEETTQAASNAELLAGPLQAIGKAWGQSIRELRLEVAWGSEEHPRTVELVTHLISSDVGAQIQNVIAGFGAMTGGGP
jgi:hypothetical protein